MGGGVSIYMYIHVYIYIYIPTRACTHLPIPSAGEAEACRPLKREDRRASWMQWWLGSRALQVELGLCNSLEGRV